MTELSAHRRPNAAQKGKAAAQAAVRRLLEREAMGGLFLLMAAFAALLLANSPLYAFYETLIRWPFMIGAGAWRFSFNAHFLVNEVLMTLFFLAVGAEIRGEMHKGVLSNRRQAGLPLIAALGGVCLPALIYWGINRHSAAAHGWAVPTATDIAFAVGILALLGKAVPANLRIILLSLAVIDDIIAVLIIAFFYSNGLALTGACIAAAAIACILLLQFFGFRALPLYVLAGALLWFGLWKTGIHPSLAGVVLGLLTPVLPLYDAPAANAGIAARPARAPVERVRQALHFWVAFGVMPLFAFVNAGVRLEDLSFAAPACAPVALGIIGGLVLGKPLGVLAASFVGVKCGLCRLPPQLGWGGMVLVGLLAGIGFTMAIFVAMLAFAGHAESSVATVAILCGSALSALLGLSYGFIYCRRLTRQQLKRQKG